jgi:hypothetical protein
MPLYFSQYNVGVSTRFNHNFFHLSGFSHCLLQGIHLGCSDSIFHIQEHCILIKTEHNWVIGSFIFWNRTQGFIEPEIKILYSFILPQTNLGEIGEKGMIRNWRGEHSQEHDFEVIKQVN